MFVEIEDEEVMDGMGVARMMVEVCSLILSHLV